MLLFEINSWGIIKLIYFMEDFIGIMILLDIEFLIFVFF